MRTRRSASTVNGLFPYLLPRLRVSWAALFLAGSAQAPPAPAAQPANPPRPAVVVVIPQAAPAPAVRVISTAMSAPCVTPAETPDPPFAGMAELPVDVLVQQVLERNPSVAQMTAAWQAASARYPQVTSRDDPMFGATAGPGAWGSNKVDGGYRIEVSQKYPWPGKLALRGQNAAAEASAAGQDVEDMRLQLAESARTTFYDYYLAERGLEVNAENLRLLRRFRQNAVTRYEARLVSHQDIDQADVELGREGERRLGLEEARQIAVARLNTLLHLPPDSPLPPPPPRVHPEEGLPDAQVLRAAALARRPDLQAVAEHIRAEQAALALAKKEYYPDVEVMAAYDAFWQEKELRPQIAVRVNLPVRLQRRRGAVAEAEARVAQRIAEYDRLADQLNFQVQEAYEKVRKSERAVALYEQTILTAARRNVESAQSAYETKLIPFLSLVEAQRNRVMLDDRYHEAVADYFRRRATLERVTGGLLEPPPSAPPPPGVPGTPPAGLPPR